MSTTSPQLSYSPLSLSGASVYSLSASHANLSLSIHVKSIIEYISEIKCEK